MDVTVIIVSYNTRDLTLACLRSVYEQTLGITFEVLVVDNASGDGSAQAIAQEFPQAKLLLPGRNLGFAGANNLAAEQAVGRYLLLLNPDTVVLDGAIQKLQAFAEQNPTAGVYGGRTLYGDMSLNPASCWGAPSVWSTCCRSLGLSHLFPANRWFDPEAMGDWARDSVREVDIVTGCLLLIRTELWRQLEGFDTRFFMYCEDADLCMRARRHGARCLICPDASIIHYRGASERVRADKVVRMFTAKAQLYLKHWPPFLARVGVGLLDLYPLVRMTALWLLSWSNAIHNDSYTTWRSIWRRRHEWNVTIGT